MGNLGDYFPEQEKQKHIDRQLQPGQVLYLFCRFTDPQKDKYLVLLCLEKRPLLFVINSSVPQFITERPHMLKCQVKLCSSDYNFLEHDSYINCAEVRYDFDELEIRNQILADVGRIRGELNSITKREIICAVKGSKTISKYYKKLIIDSLK
jgi:hypothetical protein